MLTPEDIKNLIEAEKEVFTTKTDFYDLKADFSDLQSSVESFLITIKKNGEEILALGHRVTKVEEWGKKPPQKLG